MGRLYVTTADDDRITWYDVDRDTGALILVGSLRVEGGPSPLALHPSGRWMYVSLRARNEMGALALDGADGSLQLLGRTALPGDPCYISVDRSGRWLLSAYYAGGMATVHPIGHDGLVGPMPAAQVDTARGAHCIHTDGSNRYAFLPHVMPVNRIIRFAFDQAVGTLTELTHPLVEVPGEVGPRHYVYHPTLDMVYVSNEQGSSVTAYALDAQFGQLDALQTLSTLPEGWQGKNTCAQIHLDPTGRFLYVSNRGHDSIAMYAVAPDTGKLRALGQQPTEPTPRAFNFGPYGKYLYVTGQGSNRLAAYGVRDDGRLSALGTVQLGSMPMWVLGIA